MTVEVQYKIASSRISRFHKASFELAVEKPEGFILPVSASFPASQMSIEHDFVSLVNPLSREASAGFPA